MLIRSQDKARLINLNNVEKVGIYGMVGNSYTDLDDDKSKCFVIEVHSARLGEYCTKETAIKVLDIIQDAWENQSEKFRYSFQMPQDSEVEV